MMPEESLDISHKLRMLAGFPQLATISDPVWLEVLRQAQPVTIPAGTVVVRRGSTCRHFLLLYRGRVRVVHVSQSGREIVLCRVCPGDISVLALMGLGDGANNPAEAIAETEVQALSIELPDFKKAIAGSDGFRDFVLTTMAKRLQEIVLLLGDIAFECLEVRLASLLEGLFEGSGTSVLNITHEQLAVELGTTREVISRLLKDIETKKGCIRLHRGRIELVSPVCLRNCAITGFN